MPLFICAASLSTSVQNNIPLSLYVHIPWCIKKCPYCDFNSFEASDQFVEDKYVNALLIDLDNEYQNCQQRTLGSIFFGGGTPSLFSAESIHKIINHARELFRFNDIEITLEANPGTFERTKFRQYKEAGVNRLSIGIQSFYDGHLKSLGRIHDKQQAIGAIEAALYAGFNQVNLDLMFGLPQQTTEQAVKDVKIATEFEVQHISYYQLTIEPNTWFYKHRPVLPENDQIWEMQTRGQEILASSGYLQYEISAYAKQGNECRHNLNYWNFGDYIGIGAGAHGKLSEVSATGVPYNNLSITRSWKFRQPQQYMQAAITGEAVSGRQKLEQQDIVFEFLLNALRLKSGCDIETAVKHTGLPYDVIRNAVRNIDASMLRINEERITTTEQGYLFLNDILEKLI